LINHHVFRTAKREREEKAEAEARAKRMRERGEDPDAPPPPAAQPVPTFTTVSLPIALSTSTAPVMPKPVPPPTAEPTVEVPTTATTTTTTSATSSILAPSSLMLAEANGSVSGLQNGDNMSISWQYVPGNLQVEGVVRARSFVQYSDLRLKTNVLDLVDALTIVSNLQGKSYCWRKGVLPGADGM